jgi:hypothetical protein
MGWMEDYAAQFLDWKTNARKNIEHNVQNPAEFYAKLNADARQYKKDSLENWGLLKSVMPEVRDAAQREFVASGMEASGIAPIGILSTAGKIISPLKMDPVEALARAERKQKRIDSGKPAGEWQNQPMTLLPRDGLNLPPFEIGRPTTEGWLNRVQHVMTPEEQKVAAEWYRSGKMTQPFAQAVGAENAPYHMTGFLVGNQNTSPTNALAASLRSKEQAARGIPFEARKKGGTADLPLWDLWRGEQVQAGVGQKINDFVDSAIQNPTRTFYGNQPSAGGPYTVDKLSGRGGGMVDQPFYNYLEKNYQLPEGGVKIDNPMGTWSETQYETVGDWARKLTDDLNARGYGDTIGTGLLRPADVQALDWESVQRTMGREGQDVGEAIARNTNRVASELSFGEGSPLASKFDWASLSPDAQKQLTREGLDWAMDRANKFLGTGRIGRVHATGGWQNYDPQPAAVETLMSTPEGADAFAKTVGYLAQQTEVWAARPASAGRGNAIALDILEDGGKSIMEGDRLKQLWSKINAIDPEILQGYQPLMKGGKPGIRIIIKGDSVNSVPIGLRRRVESLVPRLEGVIADEPGNFKAFAGDLDLRVHGNNWKENGDGQAYLGGLEQLIGRERVQSLRDSYGREFETFLQGKFAAAQKGPGAVAKGSNKGRAKAEVGWGLLGPQDPYIDWLRQRPSGGLLSP